jgi:hypothetical protein
MSTHVNSARLIQLQVELEYRRDTDGLLVPFPGSTEQARFAVYRYTGGNVRYFRHDLLPDVRRRLGALSPDQAYEACELVARVLGGDVACDGPFVSCVFAAMPDRCEFADVRLQDSCHVVLAGGEPVAWAWSSRENGTAAELAVETAPAFRRRGYGRQVAAAWAHGVLQQGKVAFYSYAETNVASEGLAHSLGVLAFARVVAYT